jgi:hypothetical protein
MSDEQYSENEAALKILRSYPKYAFNEVHKTWYIVDDTEYSDLEFQAEIQEKLNSFMVGYSFSFLKGVIELMKAMCIARVRDNGNDITFLVIQQFIE